MTCSHCGQPCGGHHLHTPDGDFCSYDRERLKASALAAPRADVVGALVGLHKAATVVIDAHVNGHDMTKPMAMLVAAQVDAHRALKP